MTLSNFTAGELSPRMKGRVDFQKYYNGCDTLLNMVVMPQGGATRRPGTRYVAMAESQATASRLVPFEFSTVQNYQIEFGAGVARFYMNDGPITVSGSPVQIAVPYQPADLAAIEYCQSADTLYLCHPSYPTQTLTRSSHTSWAIGALTFRDGPYLDANGTATTLTLSGTSGTIGITASSTVGINATPTNPGQGFLSTDVGRMLRIKPNGIWFWVVITGVNSPTAIQASVQAAVPNGAYGPIDGAPWPADTAVPAGWYCYANSAYYVCSVAGTTGGTAPSGTGSSITDGTAEWNYTATAPSYVTSDWQLGKWGPATGYPYVPMFWQNRLMLMGTNNQPNAIEGSVTGDFTNFAPTQADGTVAAINALSWVISDDQVNAIRWASPAGSAQAMQLGIGTTGGEEILQAATTSEAVEPANVQAYKETYLGSAPNVRPLRIGKSVLFVNRSGRKVHEWTWTWTVNGYLGPDLTVLAEHVTRSGLTQIAYQQSPHSVVWGIRADGMLVGLTYLREQDVVAWHRHPLGGQYYGGWPIVESLSVIPSPDGTYDELWLEVLRTINGVPTRTIEVMTAYFDDMLPEQGFFVDCGLSTALTYPSGTVTPAGFSNSNPATQTPAFGGAGTLSGGSFVSGNVGNLVRMNGGVLLITAVNGGVATATALLPLVNLAPAASGTWSMNAPTTTISGVGYLAGETIALLGDGQVYPQQTAPSSGSVSLAPAPTFVTAGLPYLTEVVTMPYEAARAAASAQFKLKRVDALFLRFHETVGGKFGLRVTDEWTGAVTDHMTDIQSRSAANPTGQALPLFSGVKRLRPTGSSDREGQIIASQSDPLPLTLLALAAPADVSELVQ